MMELGLADTNGILRQPWVKPWRTSAGLGWQHAYLSAQNEQPYRAEFAPAATHLLILHVSGPVTVSRGRGPGVRSRDVPTGGLFLQPADRELTVELGGHLDTVHTYLTDEALREANDGWLVELDEEFGTADPLIEQLILALDRTVKAWEPSARTYADQLTAMLAAQLVRTHSVDRSGKPWRGSPSGLSPGQFSAVRELMEQRLADPLPVADLAAAASLSVSQFTRQFKATTGQSPHQYLLRLRLDRARRLLRSGHGSVAEIASGTGFSHQEHLTRVMRAKLGTTPAALRLGG